MKYALSIIVCLAISFVSATTVWDHNVKIRESVSIDWNQATAEVGDGSVLVAWSDVHANDRDIYLQRIDANGNQCWTSPVIIDNKTRIQKSPVITRTTDGNFIIVWQDNYPSRNYNVFAQKVNSSGQLLWQVGGIPITSNTNRCVDVKIIPDNSNGAYIYWSEQSDSHLYDYLQRIDGSGNFLWQQNGIQVSGLDCYLATSIIPDNNSGCVIAYSSDYETYSYVYIKRFNSQGEPVWQNPIVNGTGSEMTRRGLLVQGSDGFYCTWSIWSDPNVMVVQKYSWQGAPVWAQPVTFVTPDYNTSYYPYDIIYSAQDNSILIPVAHNSNLNDIRMMKISSNGQVLWNGDNTLIGSTSMYTYQVEKNIRVKSDNNGGCYIVWAAMVEDEWVTDIKAQHINNLGNPTWQDGGNVICSQPNQQYYPALLTSNGNLMTLWQDMRTGSTGIYYQIINTNGSVTLEQNGRLLYYGLNSMYTEGRMTLPRQNDMVILWDDDRYGQSSSQVYMQIVNPDGSFDFANNGIPITEFTGYDQFLATALVLDNNQVVVVWHDRRTGYYEIYAQLIDSSGNRLWGATGLKIAEASEGYNWGVFVTQAEGSVFVGWNNWITNGNGSDPIAKMQKVTNGQIQWGQYGLNLVNSTSITISYLQQFKDLYAVYLGYSGISGDPGVLYTIKINPSDGSPATGWGSFGVPVAINPDATMYYQNCNTLAITPQGAFIVLKEYTSQFGDCIWVQLISPDGVQQFTPYGEMLIDPNESSADLRCNFGVNDFAVMFTDSDNTTTHVQLQRFDFTLNPLWQQLTLDANTLNLSNYALVRFSNNGFVVPWSCYHYDPVTYIPATIQYKYITPEGEFLGPIDGYSIPTEHEELYQLQAAAVGNRALITWTDGSTLYKDEPIEHTHLWAQNIINETTPINDPNEAPKPIISLKANYPNPFNPITHIGYNLKMNQRAKLSVYNLKGQLVKTLLDENVLAGDHEVIWDGTDKSGNKVTSGVYMYKLSAGKNSIVRKMMLVK